MHRNFAPAARRSDQSAVRPRCALALLAEGAVGISRVSPDKYGGRVVADAATRKTADISAALLHAGLVRRYAGGRRESWC